MTDNADMVGLTDEQTRRFQQIDDDVQRTRAGIAVWHRLLDRRRLDQKRGLHSITAFVLNAPAADQRKTDLVKKTGEAREGSREPFYVSSEIEAKALLLHCIGYLCDDAGEKLAFDKGYGARDKRAEWIIREITEYGGIKYLQTHTPYIFGIPIAFSNS
jgi:hypothetical protein